MAPLASVHTLQKKNKKQKTQTNINLKPEPFKLQFEVYLGLRIVTVSRTGP